MVVQLRSNKKCRTNLSIIGCTIKVEQISAYQVAQNGLCILKVCRSWKLQKFEYRLHNTGCILIAQQTATEETQ